MPMRKAGRGFTLVELMVVISIIGLLVTLLVPVVSSARLIASKTATTKTIKDLSMGLENYKGDFGEYPPSRPSWRTGNIPKGRMYRGAANLVWYLCGPAGNGWGVDAAGQMPYPNMSRPTRSYGPYFKATSDAVAYEQDPLSGQTVMGAILDGFKPAGNILYFRYETNPELDTSGYPKPNYQVSDNNSTSTGEGVGDPKGRTNYHSQIYFLEAGPSRDFNVDGAVRFYLWAGTTDNVYRYARTDFLLVSPGADGVYGWAKKGTDGIPAPVTRDKRVEKVGKCDDVTNFN
jgi:prepilin-type N-terminal cleavage/methylation domain-containing protein